MKRTERHKFQLRLRKISFTLTCLFSISQKALAQYAGVVPEGVLAVIGAHRTYQDQTNTWNANGIRTPLKSKARLNFDGQHLLQGEGGARLQSLAEELRRYEPQQDNPNSLVRRLNLGTLNVGGSGKLNIQYFGFALGLPARQAVYVAAPIVDLQVRTNFTLTGSNNAAAIKDELGALAYEELRSGLEQAALLTERDIKASIEAAEYTGVDSWRYRNFADIVLGYATDLVEADETTTDEPDFSLQGEIFSTAPTGHVDNPDVLSDVSIGSGTWGFGLGLAPRIALGPYTLGLEANATGYLPSRQKMRVPISDETIIPANRRTTVNVKTGLSWEVTALAEAKFDWFQPQYRFIFKRHERDHLSGQLTGNYEQLMKSSERTQWEHAVWVYFSTIEAFKRNEFPIPIRIKVAANQIFKGYNSFDESFIELQLTSFLPTPWMPE
ncbi:MAG: hypothetical protein RLZZ488_2744 [Pseudomonadota bacterium]|jgi:hypothetical protein